MVQPGVVANSAMSIKLSRLTDDSYFTQLALNAKTPEEFVKTAFEQVLSREPSSEELQTFVEQIKPEWDARIITLAIPAASPKPHRGFVTWANHFDIRANQLMRDVEREIAQDPLFWATESQLARTRRRRHMGLTEYTRISICALMSSRCPRLFKGSEPATNKTTSLSKQLH